MRLFPSIFTHDRLSKPGDEFHARVTKSGRQVINLRKDGEKRSATRYGTGTIVETRVYKKK